MTNRPWREGGDNETTFELSDNWETADEWQERLKELEDKIDEMGIVSDYGDELVEINVELETLNAEIPLLQDETKNHSQVVEKRRTEEFGRINETLKWRAVLKVAKVVTVRVEPMPMQRKR